MSKPYGERYNTPANKEAGVAGYKIASGYVYDEFLHELRGLQGRRKYREMTDNDPIVGAILSSITYMLRSTEWEVDGEDEDAKDWLYDTLWNMPDMCFDDFITEALSMLSYGFSILEVVAQKKKDGTIGLKKLAPRSQETIWHWDADDDGNIEGLWQDPPQGVQNIYIPYWKVLHFRTDYNRGNPEGRSILRNAYRSYHFVKNISMIEAIAIERELNGLPVLYAPSEILEDEALKTEWLKIVRDVKFNEQGGIILPSDLMPDSEGNPTNQRMYELKLLASEGSRNIDTNTVIRRHETNMARTIMADFIMLGDGKGSYALSEDKTSLFLKAIESIMEVIQAQVNKKLVPMLWKANGFTSEMPELRYGRIAPENLQELGDYAAKLASAGISLVDTDTENYFRRAGGLPEAEGDILSD